MYISLSGGILIYVFIAYIYPPALANLRMLRNIADQMSALLLSFEIKAQPYGYISTGWINSSVYFILTVFTWLLIGGSALVWMRHGWKMLKGTVARGLMENLDWLLYAGFAIQIAVSIVVDLSGALSGNLQLRLLPSFMVMAIVIIVRSLKEMLASAQLRPTLGKIILASSAVLSAWFTLASVFKATNEPSLSNKWTFYLPTEKVAVFWVDTHLENANLWIGVDERLDTVFRSYYELDSTSGNNYYFGKINPKTQFVLTTELDRLRAKRISMKMLPVSYWDQIYDNGQAQVDRIPLYFLGTTQQ
jgi:hypothetical protein